MIFWHRHKWYPVAVEHYIDTSFKSRSPSSSVTQQCTVCGKIETVSLFSSGFLNIEDLQRNALKDAKDKK